MNGRRQQGGYSNSWLAGSYSQWTLDEIEVFYRTDVEADPCYSVVSVFEKGKGKRGKGGQCVGWGRHHKECWRACMCVSVCLCVCVSVCLCVQSHPQSHKHPQKSKNKHPISRARGLLCALASDMRGAERAVQAAWAVRGGRVRV